MIPLFCKEASKLDILAQEIGVEKYGQLITPDCSYTLHPTLPFAVDNGCFVGFKEDKFLTLLERTVPDRERCLFVAVPDVVGSGRRTLEIFPMWAQKLAGWRRAFVVQDGMEDLEMPWYYVETIFIGGTDRFKDSTMVEHIVRAAKIIGKWVHVGRVNSRQRWDRFEAMGANSCDGTGISRYTGMRKQIATHRLFDADDTAVRYPKESEDEIAVERVLRGGER